MKTISKRIALVLALCLSGLATFSADSAVDHLASDEPFTLAGSCEFRDRLGVVFRSNLMKRHWVKANGRLAELTGETKMTDAGWFQTFTTGEVTVTLKLRRDKEGGDSVSMSGEIAIAALGKTKIFQVNGMCGG